MKNLSNQVSYLVSVTFKNQCIVLEARGESEIEDSSLA